MCFLKRVKAAGVLFVIVFLVFSMNGASIAQVSDFVSPMAQSFSQYFSPQVLRAANNMMKTRFNCEPLGHWKIWTDGFNRKFKGPDGKLEVLLNWDGMYYIKNINPEVTGDWTTFK